METFRARDHWFKLIFDSMVKGGNLSLVSEYLIVGLGGRFEDLHKYLESPRDVTGSAHVVRACTDSYRGVEITSLAIAGNGVYSE